MENICGIEDIEAILEENRLEKRWSKQLSEHKKELLNENKDLRERLVQSEKRIKELEVRLEQGK